MKNIDMTDYVQVGVVYTDESMRVVTEPEIAELADESNPNVSSTAYLGDAQAQLALQELGLDPVLAVNSLQLASIVETNNPQQIPPIVDLLYVKRQSTTEKGNSASSIVVGTPIAGFTKDCGGNNPSVNCQITDFMVTADLSPGTSYDVYVKVS